MCALGDWVLALLQGAGAECRSRVPARCLWTCALWSLGAGAAAGCGCRMPVPDMYGCVGFGGWMPVPLQGTAAK